MTLQTSPLSAVVLEGRLGDLAGTTMVLLQKKRKCQITEFLPSGYGEAASRPLFRVPDVQRRLPRVAGSAGARAWRRQLDLGLGEVAHRGVDARAGELVVLFVRNKRNITLTALMEVKFHKVQCSPKIICDENPHDGFHFRRWQRLLRREKESRLPPTVREILFTGCMKPGVLNDYPLIPRLLFQISFQPDD